MTMKDYHEQNYYELLDVKRDASQEEVMLAYKRARATYGSNSAALYSLFDKSEAEELLRLIDEAYAVLSNQFKRKEYDRSSNPIPEETQMPPSSATAAVNVQSNSEKPIHKPLTAAEEQREYERTFTPIQGVRGVLIKNNQNAKAPPGTSRFGRFEFNADFEGEIESAETFSGPFLQKIRIYKNITLDQICDVSKISRAYLASIESNDYACLPALVFLRGFLMQLAKVLDLDPVKVSTTYIKIMNEGKKK